MRKKTILYIDDSNVEREVVCRLLGSEGIEVVTAGDAGEGIELARRFKPDLILLDLHLPDMDAHTLAGSLRDIPHLEPVPIVALSSSVDEREIDEALAYCDAFMEKPIAIELFPGQVLMLIEQGRGERKEAAAAREETGGGGAALADETREVLETLESIRATMSHDLRTPLTVIISYGSTVGKEKAGPLNDRQKKMLDTLVEHGFKMDALISDLVRRARETLDKYKGSGLES